MSLEVKSQVGDEALMTGDKPPHAVDINTDVNDEKPLEQEQVVKPAQTQPLYFNGRKFDSVDQMSSYMYEQDLRYKELERRIAQPVQQQAPTEKPIEEILFEDPSQAVKIIEERIINKVRGDISQQDVQRKAWESFYNSNPDLKGNEDLVRFKSQELYNSLRDRPQDEALKIVANETRSLIQKIRGTQTTEQKLGSGPAIVAGSSGSTPARTTVQPSAPLTFSEQIKKFQRRGTK